MTLKGYQNEFEFIKKLNKKYFFELEEKLKKVIKKLFINISKNDYIICYKSFKTDKADLVIVINNIKKYISIKSGKNNSMHLEPISSFKSFLQECNVPYEIIEIYNEYHYATNELNERISIKEYQENHEEDILRFNEYINREDILIKAIDRFLFQGISIYNNNVDLLIYGTPDNFYYFTKDEIIKYLLKQKNEKFNSIHFSVLVLQPWTRNLNNNPKYEYRRDFVQVKWYRMEEFVEKI